MKTLKISDDVHQKLTALLGELVTQTSKMQTYQDAISALINESVILPQELLTQTQAFVEENKHLRLYDKRRVHPGRNKIPAIVVQARMGIHRNAEGTI